MPRQCYIEVTKHDHLSEVATSGMQLTRTVMFKDPKKDMRKIAWHILMKACGHQCVV